MAIRADALVSWPVKVRPPRHLICLNRSSAGPSRGDVASKFCFKRNSYIVVIDVRHSPNARISSGYGFRHDFTWCNMGVESCSIVEARCQGPSEPLGNHQRSCLRFSSDRRCKCVSGGSREAWTPRKLRSKTGIPSLLKRGLRVIYETG